MPDAKARGAVLEALCAPLPLAPPLRAPGALAALAARCDGFSGADLQALAYDAQLAAVQAALGHDPSPASAAAAAATPEPEPAGAGAADGAMAEAVAAAAAAVALPWVDPASAWRELSAPAAASRDTPPGVLILPEHFEQAVRSTRASTTPAERARRQAADEAFAGGVVAVGGGAKRVTLA